MIIVINKFNYKYNKTNKILMNIKKVILMISNYIKTNKFKFKIL